MNDVDALDLNLLVALDALLAEKSVTRAARRMQIGQPAASHALARLRVLFDDPLLVRVGRDMTTTPRAESLREPVGDLLARARQLAFGSRPFEARSAERVFRLICPDLLVASLGRLVARLRKEAPRCRLEIENRQRRELGMLEDGRADVALVPAPEDGPGLVRRSLGAVRFAVVARKRHPVSSLDTRAWAAHPHVMVRTGHGGESIVGGALERARVQRTIGLVVPTFLAALVAVSESDAFFTAPRELVRPLARRLGLKLLPPPIDLPVVRVAALWHERYQADAAHRFFRAIVCEEVAPLLR
jgi:DNA-binding transcriptional LysR family regulator